MHDEKLIFKRNTRGRSTKFCMYVEFHELLKKVKKKIQDGRQIQDGGQQIGYSRHISTICLKQFF